MTITMTGQEHNRIVVDLAKGQWPGRFAIGRGHDLPMRYLQAFELSHSRTANDRQHALRSDSDVE